MLHIIYCMVSVQQANLSEYEGRKTSVMTPLLLLKSISLIWDSRVMLNFPIVVQPLYCMYTRFTLVNLSPYVLQL